MERNKVRNKERTHNQVAHMGDFADDMTRTNTLLSLYHLTRIVWHELLFGSLAFLNISRAL